MRTGHKGGQLPAQMPPPPTTPGPTSRAGDDALLAAVLRRFLDFPGHPAHEPFVMVDGDLFIEGRVDLTPEELAAVERAERKD